MPRVDCVIPWRGGCPHRERAWRWVASRYAERHPDWGVAVAEAAPGAWVKASAVMPAVEASRAEIIVIADADIWHPNIEAAVGAVEDGAAWAIPHRGVFRLTEAATARFLGGAEDFEALELEQPAYLGTEGGGYVIARRETLLEVPMPRFEGWGQEDESWGAALRCLVGRPWRGKGPLVHLYHPAQERLSRRWGSAEGRILRRRYRRARNDPDAMRALIHERD